MEFHHQSPTPTHTQRSAYCPRPRLSTTNEINSHPPTNTGASLRPSADRTQICDHRSQITSVYQQHHQDSNRPAVYTTCRTPLPTPVHTSTMHTHRPTQPSRWHSTGQQHLLPTMSHFQPRDTPRHTTRTDRYHTALHTPGSFKAYVPTSV